MRFADFAKKHFPLTHPRSIRRIPKAKKRRKTVSGFQAGDRVRYPPVDLFATINWVRGYRMYVTFDDNSSGIYQTTSWQLVN